MRMRHLLGAVSALAAMVASTAAYPQAATQSGTVPGGSSNFLWGMYQVGSQNSRPILVQRVLIVNPDGTPAYLGGGGGGGGGPSGSVTAPGTNGSVAQAMQGINGGIPFAVTGSFLQDTTFTTRIPTNGQKAKAGSVPVTIASDQDTLTVAIASNVLAANAATATAQATGNTSLASIDAKTPALTNGKVPIDGTVLADLRVAGALNSSSNPIFAQITNFPANQTVSGTVTANLGTLNGAALDTTVASVGTSNTSIANATGTTADPATASGANTTLIGAARAVRDRLLGTLNVVIGAGSATIGAVTQAGVWAVNSTLQAGSAIIGKVGIDQTTPGVTNGVQILNQALQTTANALEPPTCASAAKCPPWFAALSANTSTQLVAANANRIAVSIQCSGAGAVAVSETGVTLTTATPASGAGISALIPAGSTPPYFTPPVTSRTLITGYSGTAQSCWGTEYLR